MHLNQTHSEKGGNWSEFSDLTLYPQWPKNYGLRQTIKDELKGSNKKHPALSKS